ncbi:FAD-dependent oxidoreductase [Nonomuraea sp. NPDC050643]|uniref:flavin monoamine oxidase family protein n=1 Tax=Nonomuraea sp. NPDC050643 TaxID=3155660 RepID=UPI00340CEE6B
MFRSLRTDDESGPSAGEPRRVTVLGAGVAGLVAAYELERLGHQVEIIEASNRVGGRVYTHRFGAAPDAPFADLGAMRLRTDHTRTLHYLTELGLLGDIREFRTLFADDDNVLSIEDDRHIKVSQAPTVLTARLAERLGDHSYRPATLLFGAWLNACLRAIAPRDFHDWPEVSTGLLDLVDRIDLEPYLRGDGSKVDLHAVVADHPQIRSGVFRGHERLLDDVLDETSPALYRLRGGMATFTNALAARIRGRVSLGHEVVGLSVRDDGVAVGVRHEGKVVYRHCDYVLCTIPFTVLREAMLDGFDSDKLAAVHETQYWPATKIALLCREPFWAADGIAGGASFTGGLVRQTYYPPVEGDPAHGAVLLASYTIGPDAEEMGRLDPAARYRVVLNEVGRMHPGLLERGMIRDAVGYAWGRHRWSLGAATIRWGQDARTREEQQWAAARPQGRLFFAGEHCSSMPAWIEGAIESVSDVLRDMESRDPRELMRLERRR